MGSDVEVEATTINYFGVFAHTVAETAASDLGITFSPLAQTALNKLIQDGLALMAQRGELQPPYIKEAEKNLVAFLSEVADEAKIISDSYVEEPTLAAVQMRFCPVYPFS